jgi:hypothetical protein
MELSSDTAWSRFVGPLVWSSDNDAHLEGILFEVGKFFKRKGLFQPFFKHHAAALRNGKLAVDHYGSTLFTTNRIKDEHDFHNPCPPTAQRLANYEISRNTPGSPHNGGKPAPSLAKIPDECADTTVLSQHAVEATYGPELIRETLRVRSERTARE